VGILSDVITSRTLPLLAVSLGLVASVTCTVSRISGQSQNPFKESLPTSSDLETIAMHSGSFGYGLFQTNQGSTCSAWAGITSDGAVSFVRLHRLVSSTCTDWFSRIATDAYGDGFVYGDHGLLEDVRKSYESVPSTARSVCPWPGARSAPGHSDPAEKWRSWRSWRSWRMNLVDLGEIVVVSTC
jgi:hypothetical protein